MFESLLSWLNAMGASTNHPLVLAVLAGSAAVEFVFPPFPGDTVTLLGGILVGAYQWNLALVFSSLMLGSIIGGYVAFRIGKGWQRRRVQAIAEDKGRLARLVRQFDKHGSWFLLLNRFLPGIRPLFFVAAGLAGMGTRRVLVLSGISAALWNALIMVAGIAMGHNLDRLEEWRTTYTAVVSLLLVVILVFFVVKRLRQPSEE